MQGIVLRSRTTESSIRWLATTYCFFSNVVSKKEKLSEGPGTVFVMVDMDSGAVMACQCRAEGRKDPYAVAAVNGFLSSLGVRRVTLQTDGEPALKDRILAVKKSSTIEILAEQSHW